MYKRNQIFGILIVAITALGMIACSNGSGGGKIRASKVDVDTGGPGGRYRAWVETPVANKMFGDLTGYSDSVGLPSFIAVHASDIAEFINKYGNGAPAIAHQSGVEKIPHN